MLRRKYKKPTPPRQKNSAVIDGQNVRHTKNWNLQDWQKVYADYYGDDD
ncbi:hypothetical protein [Moorena sp. SIO3A2]|nr:hypothetical protein [Moorena sp. SIO3A2]NER90374.1 hypothetical protein [Moorena sp. SIO3A2]